MQCRGKKWSPVLPMLLVLASLAGTSAQLQAAEGPRNVLMIVVDDQGLDTGAYGNKAIKTPALDALAAAGTRFTHGFCTTASCSASRSVILTGLHNHANGQFGHQHSFHDFTTHAFVKSLPVLLGAAGYRTCSVGKFHVGPEPLYHFETYANEGIQGARNSVRMAANADKFLRANDPRPFFLYFCTSDPHRGGPGFANDKEYPGVTEVKYSPDQVIVPNFLPDEPEVRAELAEYYQAVSRLDQGVGRLLQTLKETGQWENTLILFLSDNGIPFPGAKTNLYEPGMRLPLIVRDPRLKTQGGTCDALVSWADLTPTILDFTGVSGPKYPLHGKSFLSVIGEEHPKGWDTVYGSHTFHEVTMYYPMRVIRTRKYKLFFNVAHQLPFPFASDLYASPTWQGVLKRKDSRLGRRSVEAYLQRARFELYDLENDPDEIRNLADDPAHAKTLEELQERLKAWQTESKDPWIVKYDYE